MAGRWRMRLLPLVVLPAALLVVGCSGKGAGFGTDGDGGDGDESGTLPPINGGDGGEGGAQSTHCSADLHQILDQDNVVVQTCPPDQGCGKTGCVPACQSAEENKSTVGCDYYAVEPDTINVAQGGCFAAFVANTWGVPIKLAADYNGQQLNLAQAARISQGSGQSITYTPLPNGELPVDQVAFIFLARNASIACPGGVTPGIGSDGAAHGTTIGHAFHITSSAPVVAYDIYPFGGSSSYASSATLLLPSTAWGTNYVATAPYEKDVVVSFAQPSLAVAARETTDVTISPTAAIVGGGGVAPTGKGVPHTYHLNKGEVLQFTQDAQLTGSPIQTTKPVGVWAVATCLNIDVSDTACDAAHQQIPPVPALGHEYVAVRYRNRAQSEESVPWRIVGAVPGTNLTYFPSAPQGAPLSLSQGTLQQFWTPGPFVVKSQDDQHPFYMSGHMTGQDHPPASGTGDPEFVNVIPAAEFLASYVFFTDPTYANTNLVLVRKNYGQGFQEVSLDCLGNVASWKPIGGTAYEYTRVDLTINAQAQGKCNNGLHKIKSSVPFGLTVWGWDQYVSYAYPAGASVQPINTVIVPATPN